MQLQSIVRVAVLQPILHLFYFISGQYPYLDYSYPPTALLLIGSTKTSPNLLIHVHVGSVPLVSLPPSPLLPSTTVSLPPPLVLPPLSAGGGPLDLGMLLANPVLEQKPDSARSINFSSGNPLPRRNLVTYDSKERIERPEQRSISLTSNSTLPPNVLKAHKEKRYFCWWRMTNSPYPFLSKQCVK